MSEKLLPIEIRQRANVSPGGEHAWRIEDYETVIMAAKQANLASLGGQAQFIFPEGVCEMYWISFDSESRKLNETWDTYVARSADEVIAKFQAVCYKTDFVKEARDWEFIQKMIDSDNIDPLKYLWFVGYFQHSEPLDLSIKVTD